MIEFILDIPLNSHPLTLDNLFHIKPASCQRYSRDGFECLLWGDPVVPKDYFEKSHGKVSVRSLVGEVQGHYYFLLSSNGGKTVVVGNSMFSVVPIYYRFSLDSLSISHNTLTLAQHSRGGRASRRFILETMLFNYPLFDASVVHENHLLPCNSMIIIEGGKWRIEKHVDIVKYFNRRPRPWRKSLDEMAEIFINQLKKYLPDHEYSSSLTGGFDGRTLVAGGLNEKKRFSCYSFGPRGSKDVTIASELCQAAGIPYEAIKLDEQYIKHCSLECGLEFIRGASGNATFARAHYLYAARELAKKTEYIITGNFGSEVFRAAHVPGVVIAPNLFRLFDADSLQEGIRAISNSSEFSYLNCRNFRNEWEELKVDLERLPRFNAEYRSLSRNQQFYIFVFEEIFRKYFGAEIINQFHYVKNRTPFLDWDFLKAIFQTGLAGIYSSFFEHNPIKRYKGQVLYAHIIRKTYPEFGLMMTDKGYRPDDLTTWEGKISIICGYIKKRINRKILMKSDPYSVIAAFESNRNVFNNIEIDSDWFNAERISKEMNANPGEALFKPLSLAYIMGLMEHR